MAAAILLLAVQVHDYQVFRLHHSLGEGGVSAEHQVLAQANGDIAVSAGHVAAAMEHPADPADLLAHRTFAFQSHSPLFRTAGSARELYRSSGPKRRGVVPI